jgi:hypothetical protein
MRTRDIDVVGKLEPPFEITGCNTHMQKVPIVIAFGLLAAGDDKQVLLGNNIDLFRFETGDGDGDLIIILAGPLDVKRGIIFILRRTACGFEQLKKAVKANGVPAIWGKIKTVHANSPSSNLVRCQPRKCSGQHVRFGAFRPPRSKMGCIRKIARAKNSGERRRQ